MSEKITFKELVELIAEQSRQSQSTTNSFVSELVQVIENGLRKSGSVSISGFGKFELRWMKERSGVNPQTGESITIPGQNKVVFKPYKSLREDVNRPYAKMKAQILDTAVKKEGDKDDKEAETQKTEITPLPLSPPRTDTQEEESDLIVERPVPVKSVPVEEEDLVSEEAPFDLPAEEKEEAKSPAIPAPVPDLRKVDQSELAKEVQNSGSMNWSYAAAAVLVALIIFALMFFIQREDEPSEQVATTQTEQLTAPADQTSQATDQSEIVEEEPDQPPPAPPPFETEVHQVQQGQSLWTIAEAQLGNPYLWPLIYDMNPDLLDNPNIIEAGVNLTIPIVTNPENLTNDQLEMVAAGYYSVYEWALEAQPEQAKHFLWAVGVFSPDKLSKAQSYADQKDWAFAKYR